MNDERAREHDRPRILVVEDSDDFRLLLETTLRDEGYIVDAVSCAEDGLRMLESRRYRLVLCDYSLPGHSGTWLLTRAQFRSAGEKIPAVLITGDPDAPGIPDDIEVVAKPVDFDRLLSDIQGILADADEPVRTGAGMWPRQHSFQGPHTHQQSGPESSSSSMAS
jgi:DNA-binding NtrC family response regulator